MVSGIYVIENKINGHKYVGSAVNIKNRWRIHKHLLLNNKHKNAYLQNAWNKYGQDNFLFDIIEYIIDVSELIKIEQYYIDWMEPEYNINPIAENSLGVKRSIETKRKMSIAAKSRPSPNKNKKMSDEQKKKISSAQKGRISPNKNKKMSNEQKNKISIANSGKVRSEEQRKKISNKNNHNFKDVPQEELFELVKNNFKLKEIAAIYNIDQRTLYTKIKVFWGCLNFTELKKYINSITRRNENEKTA